MAIQTTCQTPGTYYGIHIQPYTIDIAISLPKDFNLTKEEAIQLEHTIHNSLELALAPLFVRATAQLNCPPPN